MRRTGDERYVQRLEGQQGGIIGLAAARGREEPEGGVIAQAVVDREMTGDSPRILTVKSHPLHILRKSAVAGRRVGAGCIRRGGGAADQVLGELLRVRQIIRRIHCELRQVLRSSGKRAAQDWLVNEVDAAKWRVPGGWLGSFVA